MKLRVAFENDLIKDYVEERIRGVSLRKNAANITDRTLVNSSPIVRTPVAQLDKLRIAVLPFLNISRDPSDEYFTNGMTEEMISSLSKLGGLKVIARTSVLPFRDEQKRKNIEEIAQELRVGTIVDGSVRTDGDKLRISIQLIDCENGESLWSESFDRNLKDVLSIQAEVSSSVVEALKVHLPIQPRKKTEHLSTKNPLAYEMYLKGRYCMRSFYSTGEADFRRSIEYLQHAVKLDPSYAEAYAWLSTAYSILAYNAWARTTEILPMAKEAVKKALELDPNSAEAYNALFLISYCTFDWKGCEDAAKKVLELNPNLIEFHELYHYYLLTEGKLEESLVAAKKAVELDPLSTWANIGPPLVVYYQRDYDSAIEQFKRLLEFDPDSLDASQYLGRCYLFKTDYEQALKIFQRALDRLEHRMEHSPSDDQLMADVACIYALMGKKDEARNILKKFAEASKDRFIAAWEMIYINLCLGENAEALRIIENAYKEQDYLSLSTLKVDPFYDVIRSDPRFLAILEKVGL